MQTPKYKIGDTVYIAHTRLLPPPKCEKCGQYEEDREGLTVDETVKHTVEGVSIREGMREADDGIFYQLSSDRWAKVEERVFPTSEAALENLREYRKQTETAS